jgi:uncharacterized protein (TIGR01777 family)
MSRSASGPGVHWDPAAGRIDAGALEGVGAVVHLAGAGIGDKRWSEPHKQLVLDSRVTGTTLLAETLAKLDHKPSVLVSGSAVGYYGDRGDEVLTEASSPGQGFLSEVCQKWEAATAAAEDAGIRVVRARTGIVLSRHGGALKKMLLPFRVGAGGRMGSGRQWMSWITLEDEVDALIHLIANDSLVGPVNLTAPAPVTNAAFTKSLGKALHRPAAIPVPAAALKVALGSEMASELLLSGQRAVPTQLETTGYRFAHPEIDVALPAVVAR